MLQFHGPYSGWWGTVDNSVPLRTSCIRSIWYLVATIANKNEVWALQSLATLCSTQFPSRIPSLCLVSEGSLTISKAVGEPRPQRDPSSLHVPDTPISSPGDSVTQALPLPPRNGGVCGDGRSIRGHSSLRCGSLSCLAPSSRFGLYHCIRAAQDTTQGSGHSF